ncbi:MAG: outer membrane protein assembly factor BamD [Aaplasma endosymbiont of Hyalomma asiaticum]
MNLRSVLFAIVAIMVVLPGLCYAEMSDDHEESIHRLYERGKALFDKKRYKEAVETFDKIESLYPFSQAAINGSLMAAVANYELKNYKEAATIAEGYIGIYPNSESIDYAYYIRIISKYMMIPDLGLDATEALEVFNYAVEFTKMFPESEYVADVQERLEGVRQHISAKEFSIGKYYLKRGEYVAAIKRLSVIVEAYPDSRYYGESVYRLFESYMAIGDHVAARRYLKLAEGSVWHAHGVMQIEAEEAARRVSGQELMA